MIHQCRFVKNKQKQRIFPNTLRITITEEEKYVKRIRVNALLFQSIDSLREKLISIQETSSDTENEPPTVVLPLSFPLSTQKTSLSVQKEMQLVFLADWEGARCTPNH